MKRRNRTEGVEGAEGAAGVEGRRNGGRRARGFAFIVVALMILAGGVFFDPLFGDALEHYRNLTEGVAGESEKQTRDAKDALEHYMLTRAPDRGWAKIRRSHNETVEPRLLMLPCPDNLGDENLDGTQDPHCGREENLDPLKGGSRFGRLPWNIAGIAPSYEDPDETDIGDGLGIDFKDGTGNRLWYAASRNFVPIKTGAHLLNLHGVSRMTTDWLSVVNESGQPVSDRVAAVILSPGRTKIKQERMHEVELNRLSGEGKLRSNDERVAADLYFEEVELDGGRKVRNYENDGEFIGASEWTKEQTNDRLAFLSLDEMLSSDSHFMRQYKAQVGVRRAHNHPLVGSPLDRIQKGISAYYDFFGFYPVPAALSSPSNVETQNRHCAEWKIPEPIKARMPEGVTLLTPTTVTATVAAVGAEVSTIGLMFPSAFLVTERMAVTLVSEDVDVIVSNDRQIPFETMTVTLARLARITLMEETALAISMSLTVSVSGTLTISAGVSVFTPALMQTILLDDSLLAPDGVLFGWLPEHSRTQLTAGRDGSNLIASTATRVGFMSPDFELKALSWDVEILPGDKFYVPAQKSIKLEKDLTATYKLNKLIRERPGTLSATLRDVIASEETREKQGLVVLLTTDTLGSARRSVKAPAVVYPWRPDPRGADRAVERDNLHPYPPCFDSRDILDDAHRLFIEDQPMHYAVAANCHYGGEKCGGPGGLTVTIAADVGFALPSPYAVSGDYAITLAARPVTTAFTIFMATIQITDGTISAIRANGRTMTAIFPSGSQWIKANERDDARARVGSRFTLSASATLKFPAGIPFKTLDSAVAVVEDADALLMYSPAPLRSVECAHGLDEGEKSELELRFPSRVELTVSDQRRSAALDLRQPCNWLDLDENADGDATFTIPPPRASRQHPDFNDYFLLFGGNVSVIP